MNEVLELLLSVTLFPGLVFIVALALFNEWFVRKLVARTQNRMGPSYVGPMGILQPLADLLKLISVKEDIRQKYSLNWLAKLFGFLALGAAVSVLLFLPLSPIRLAADYDFLIYIYLCCVWVPLAFIIMGLSSPNPFSSVGVSRLLSLITVYEPAYFTAMLAPVVLVQKFYSVPVSYSVYYTSVHAWQLWFNPIALPAMVLAFLAVLVSAQAKAMYQPFNIPEAEQELIAGFETEFSGQTLGLLHLLHDTDITVTLLYITYFFLGGPYPYSHLSIEGVLIFVIKYILLLTIVSIVKSSFGRYKIEQAISVIAKYSLAPALLAILYTVAIINIL